MTHLLRAAAIGLGLALPAAALADEAPCALTYETFEFAVPHVDLEACPGAVDAPADAFCRASVANDMVHVFAFASDGAQCLIGVRSIDEEEYSLTIEG